MELTKKQSNTTILAPDLTSQLMLRLPFNIREMMLKNLRKKNRLK
jgi:hypothetical protein